MEITITQSRPAPIEVKVSDIDQKVGQIADRALEMAMQKGPPIEFYSPNMGEGDFTLQSGVINLTKLSILEKAREKDLNVAVIESFEAGPNKVTVSRSIIPKRNFRNAFGLRETKPDVIFWVKIDRQAYHPENSSIKHLVEVYDPTGKVLVYKDQMRRAGEGILGLS